ncbi:MAG: Ubiquitin-conjugating enzyme E2 C [Phylliscum demangeonii]|nr:MAG: Ubiquitin-conjugating enzyme E2 C [Phylliscum demangeonii]
MSGPISTSSTNSGSSGANRSGHITATTSAALPSAIAGPRQDMITVTKRLQTELMQLMISTPPGISAFPSSADGNLMKWTGTIIGPEETPYAGLKFKLTFRFPVTYPFQPPALTFKTPIYHPNVDFSGRICLDILADKWSAVYNVQTVLLSVQSLLGEPNNSSPLNAQAAELWDEDPAEFKRLMLLRYRNLDEDRE